jgi:hypothetical protein
LYRTLLSVLKPYDNWFNNVNEKVNQEAKKTLYIFYYKLMECKLPKEYQKRDIWHAMYINHLVKIKKAFMEHQYLRVYNEFLSLIHYEPFLQHRIYYNILNITVYSEIYDLWTPDGMLVTTKNDTINISGTVFDDWTIVPVR